MEFHLNPDLLLGAASAATQIEGDASNHCWFDWYQKGFIKDGSDPSAAVDHFQNWRADLQLMREIGIQCYRMSLEWSRIEPGDGFFDESVIARYRAEISALRDAGIPVLLTLHHFSSPVWLESRGGFANRDNVTCFLRFVRKMTESLGDLVSEFITINEPNVYAYNAFLQGAWPPGRKSFLDAARVMTNLAAAHIEAYGIIRKTRLHMGFQDTKVGVANHLRVFAPKDPSNPLHRFWAERAGELFQDSLTKAMCIGVASFPVGKHPSIVPGRYCDFHGVSYFSRSTLSGPAALSAPDGPVNDLGWEIFPQGIVQVCRKLYDFLPRPVYITANGACDHDDSFRARFIAEHLSALSQSGLPVRRYYYWSFSDGWEWTEGRSARFGLVSAGSSPHARSIKKSGLFYQRLIREHGVTEDMFREFCGAPYPVRQEENA